jgi:hypothetical protein
VHNRCNEEVLEINMLVQTMFLDQPTKGFPGKEQGSDETRVILNLKKMDVDGYIFLAVPSK